MGIRESKPSTITYEEAIKYKRVDESDLNRLREAFRRIAPSSSYISQQVFIREVLGPGVPVSIAKNIFTACGGTSKGIAFKDLVCGLILLTKGTIAEKEKFLFNIYSEDGDFIHRNEFLKTIQATESRETYETLANLFTEDKISFPQFEAWVLSYPISASQWLLEEHNSPSLSHDYESPNFYQTLAGVTHLEEQDIMDLERAYNHLASKATPNNSCVNNVGGKLTLSCLAGLLSPPVPASVVLGLFSALDENCDGVVDFKEMACGVSAAARGPLTERQKFCFKVFDKDRDNVLNEMEIRHMVQVLQSVKKENLTAADAIRENFDEEPIVKELLDQCSSASDGLTVEEYLIWSVANDALVSHFVNLIFQVCHIVLGLRPSSRQEEGELVSTWLEREVRRGLIVGQYWNLIHMEWWHNWRAYVSGDKTQETTSGVGSENDGPPSTLTKNNSTASFKSFTLGKKSAANFLVGNSLASDQSENVVTKLVRPLDNNPSTHYTHNRTASYHSLIYEPFSNSNASPMLPRKRISKPGPIDNSSLIVPSDSKIPSLTSEGGKLRRNLELSKGREFELLPASLWKVLHSWYGGGPALPRQVIKKPHCSSLVIEYYPVSLNLYRHVFPSGSNSTNNSSATWSGGTSLIGGYGPASSLINNASSYSLVSALSPKRHVSHTATLSCLATVQQVCDFVALTYHLNRQDVRLWQILNQEQEDNLLLLEDECVTLEELGVDNENNNVLVEVRNKDLTWPEEINKLATAASLKQVASSCVPGVTGLNNLGNTCFMNAALQCVSNTAPLTTYFTRRLHRYELNRSNPLGMRGHIATRYGDLIGEIWSGTAKTLAPLKLRLTIGRYAPRFIGFQQHDSQEFLSFLLDGLHEDLNRVTVKPYVELKDSDDRPDEVVAQEAWENHLLRNRSIIVDLFHGQLKSKVTCLACRHESVRFDPFNYLSLPLPIETSLHIDCVLMRLDGSTPVKYGLKASRDDTHAKLKLSLSHLCGIPTSLLRLAELRDGRIASCPTDDEPLRLGVTLCHAYELPGGDTTLTTREGGSLPAIQRSIKPKPSHVSQGSNLSNISEASTGSLASSGSFGGSCVSSLSEAASQSSPSEVFAAPLYDKSCSDENSQTLYSNKQCHVSNKVSHLCSSRASHDSCNVLVNEKDRANEDVRNDRACDKPEGDSGVCSPVSCHSESSDKSKLTSPGEESDDNCDSGNCSASSSSLADSTTCVPAPLVAYHRKMLKQSAYFLSAHKYRPILFGIPVIVPCNESSTQQDLYQAVWLQVSRLVTPLPPIERIPPNHAMDCDDSLGYQYPFVLKAVTSDGMQCSLCPWFKFCPGCKLACDDSMFSHVTSTLAIDWDPTALHLRYQSSLEKVYEEHATCIASRKEREEPISLASCLESFTKEEKLGEKEKYFCPKCASHQFASKKLEIYRLPPILIVHLKRFQLVDEKWIKCSKVVEFPRVNFDPSRYLVDKEGELHEHRLAGTAEGLKYNLYGIVSHSGRLGGGHYIATARHVATPKWFMYNDSSVRQILPDEIDTSAAYMLFYEREGLDMEAYLPDVSDKQMEVEEEEEYDESEMKKACVVM